MEARDLHWLARRYMIWSSIYYPSDHISCYIALQDQTWLLCCFSVTQLYLNLFNPMDCSMPGYSVLHYLLEFAQNLIRWISDAIQPSHPLLSPSSPALNLSQHQGLLQCFAWGGQGIGASASAPVLPMNIQGWFSLGLTGLISLLSKGPSRDFSSTTVRKHQFFCPQPSLWSKSHIYTWLLEKP